LWIVKKTLSSTGINEAYKITGFMDSYIVGGAPVRMDKLLLKWGKYMKIKKIAA